MQLGKDTQIIFTTVIRCEQNVTEQREFISFAYSGLNDSIKDIMLIGTWGLEGLSLLLLKEWMVIF